MLMKYVGGGGGEELQLVGVFVQRMAGDVEAEGLFFVAKFFFLGPFRLDRRFRSAGWRRCEHAEQRVLSALLLVLRPLLGIGRCSARLEEIAPRAAQEIERSRLDQRLDDFLVAGAQIDRLAELQQRRELPDAAARLEDRVDRAGADALHRAEAEADV